MELLGIQIFLSVLIFNQVLCAAIEGTRSAGMDVVSCRGNANVKRALDVLDKAANHHGLIAADIDTLIDVVISNKFGEFVECNLHQYC
jgi:hypothetical protein